MKVTYVVCCYDQLYFAHSDGLTKEHENAATEEGAVAISGSKHFKFDDVEVMAVLDGHSKVLR